VEHERHSVDDGLILSAREGSLDAFNVLVEQYQDAVYGLCRRLLADSGAAEDAAQEAFISAFRAIRSFSGGNFRAWLFRIAANESKDELRRRQRRPQVQTPPLRDDAPITPDPVDETQDIVATIEQIELGAQIEQALLQVSFEQRQAIVLADIHGYRYEEIASIAGCSLGTVKSRISRGRERLKVILSRDPELSARFARLDTREETKP
jgi:RNA polymerase sigma-70 factor (ECF subfamily)